MPRSRKTILATSLATALGALVSTQAAVAASPVNIVPHRAVYKLSLGKSAGGASVVAAEGLMVMEWTESCAGWEVQQRIKLRLHSRQNREVDTDTIYTSTESKDGTRYRFATKTLYDGKLHEEFRGRAALKSDGSGGTVLYTVPEGKTRKLERGTLFPTAHTLHLIRQAIAGKKLDFAKVFDGTSKTGSYRASTVITGMKKSEVTTVQNPLAAGTAWGMRVAFFPDGMDSSAPEWELAVALQPNGVTQHLVLDYGDFSVNARMQKIEPLKRPKC